MRDVKAKIVIKGAKEHNLKNIDLSLPRNSLIAISGKSGSGKSSLAFDTIFAEGQRRYMESVSAYARQFLGNMKKPDVESIEGLSPAISIEQKTINNNPRSTVATITEIYDYYRLLYARIGKAYCPNCKILIEEQSVDKIIDSILNYSEGAKIILTAPLVRGVKGTHKKTLERIFNDGFVRVIVNGEAYLIEEALKLELDKNKKHYIDVIVDRVKLAKDARKRLSESVELALSLSNGFLKIIANNNGREEEKIYSEHNSCSICGFSISEIEPRLFSFNSPFGACPDCDGLGISLDFDIDKILPNKKLSFNEGAFTIFFKTTSSWGRAVYEAIAKHYGFTLDTKIKDIDEKILNKIFYGTDEKIYVDHFSTTKRAKLSYNKKFEGLIPILRRRYLETDSGESKEVYEFYMSKKLCLTCNGKRLSREALSVYINELNISDLASFSVSDSILFFKKIKLSQMDREISKDIIKEIKARLSFLENVGLSYLTLNRLSGTLSGGEAQRIRLATQIGSALVGVLYILDEPSIGLHQRDNERLINTLTRLRDLDNTVIVVEHDEQTLRVADYLVDMGPKAGIYGGEVVAKGTLKDILNTPESLTGQYLSGKKKIEVPQSRRAGNGNFIKLFGASKNNLKKINISIPLGTFTVITGVSGSGKSTLLNEVLYPAIYSIINGNLNYNEGFKKIEGVENIDKIIQISQKPIGRTPRSNPATYVGVFTNIRELFASLPEAKERGFKAGRFSFNVKGGRCENCEGEGSLKIQMHFLPDVYVKCDICNGRKFNRETLEVKYMGKNIYDVLEMSVDEAYEFFKKIPSIKKHLKVLREVGLDYIKLGQSALTLSGGEAQRVKLSLELSKRSTGKTFYIIDEPTTGLHFDDIKKLLEVLHILVESGNTVVLIEHNLDVIKQADYIIDLGPDGGVNGGELVISGTPQEVIKCQRSYTGKFLKEVLI